MTVTATSKLRREQNTDRMPLVFAKFKKIKKYLLPSFGKCSSFLAISQTAQEVDQFLWNSCCWVHWWQTQLYLFLGLNAAMTFPTL